jgi:hypothetical protein
MKTGFQIHYWLKWAFFNLLLVAALGLLMRFKVVFELPWVNQKNLQLAHAQFAFQGWIAQLLLVFLIHRLQTAFEASKLERLQRFLLLHQWLNLGVAGLVVWQGMGPLAFFSPVTLYVIQAYLFWQIYVTYRKKGITANWLGWGMVFAICSWLSVLMLGLLFVVGKMTVQHYLGWHYTYLHFQYNGWFFFAAVSLLMETSGLLPKAEKKWRYALVFSGFAGVLLSLLWLKLPWYLQLLAGITALVQLLAWLAWAKNWYQGWKKRLSPTALGWLLGAIAFAWTLKQLLQPALLSDTISAWAYGFRPVIIAYLHLVLLGVYSLFLIYYAKTSTHDKRTASVWWFLIAVVMNELLLGWHGILSINYLGAVWIDGALLIAAAALFIGSLWLWLEQFKRVSAA